MPGGAEGLVTARHLRALAEGTRHEPLDRIKRAEVAALSRAADVLASSVSVQLPGAIGTSGLLPRIICDAGALLKDYPALNGCFVDDGLELRDRVDVGVALDLGRGLRVVTIRDAHAATPAGVEQQLYSFTERYLSETLRPDDIAPATFTVTDLSGLGACTMQPLIGEAQAAILAVTGGMAEAGTPVVLTLVFDHRVSNGRTAAMFLSDLRDRLVPAAVDEREPAPEPSASAAALDTRRCDRCGITLEAYYDRHRRDALMQVWVRPDGSLGAICHVCASGVF